ncbi:MAG: helix-turn-helix domain-containing protein [Tannerella sp.]|nr:helix-turn-helix domain-containing protein [Tannerella sp.]
MSDSTILQLLGRQIKQMRLNINMTQKQLSQKTGVSRSIISVIENSGQGSTSSLAAILRGLEKLEILNVFITNAPVSPIQVAKLGGKIRQRASVEKQAKTNNNKALW